jgi:hypothetical protein
VLVVHTGSVIPQDLLQGHQHRVRATARQIHDVAAVLRVPRTRRKCIRVGDLSRRETFNHNAAIGVFAQDSLPTPRRRLYLTSKSCTSSPQTLREKRFAKRIESV